MPEPRSILFLILVHLALCVPGTHAADGVVDVADRERAEIILRDTFAQTDSLDTAEALVWNGIDSGEVLVKLSSSPNWLKGALPRSAPTLHASSLSPRSRLEYERT